MRLLILFFLLGAFYNAGAQQLKMLHSGNKVSIRGLSVVNDKIIWVSGNKGTVGRSLDSGKTWKWLVVKDFEQRDFRDIEAFDAVTAVIMAVGEPANILKTVDGGHTWKVVYENKTAGMFLDAMEFWNIQSGIVIGDPINGKFFIARSFDGGSTWGDISEDRRPVADSGEACFAASGTNVRAISLSEAGFITGGNRSRLLWRGTPIDIPIIQGTPSTGANSFAVRDAKKRKRSHHFVVVGGDYKLDTLRQKNCVITQDGGKTWIAPTTPPGGYRSCVEYISKTRLLTCGTSGVDISDDGGMNWNAISDKSFHVCRKAKSGKSVFLAGADGNIAILIP